MSIPYTGIIKQAVSGASKGAKNIKPFDEQNTEDATGTPKKGSVHKSTLKGVGNKPYGTHGTHSGG